VEDRNLVSDLAAILRLAEALDRSHKQVIKDLNVVFKESSKDFSKEGESISGVNLVLSLHEGQNCLPEIWALNEKKAFFEEHYGVRLEASVASAASLAKSDRIK
jgi:exopolyphosphatase/guanosine-5'-triphosphate,3'-diphosphate pyrophosphatase